MNYKCGVSFHRRDTVNENDIKGWLYMAMCIHASLKCTALFTV